MYDKEQIWLDSDNSSDPEYGYNKSPTAGSSLGVKFSQEVIQHIKEARNRPESRKASSDALKGKPKSAEHRLHLSLAKKGHPECAKNFGDRKGENNGMFGDHRWAGENNPMYGVHRTGENNPNAKLSNIQIEEIKAKWLSGSYTRKQFSEEYSEKYNVSKSTIYVYIDRASRTRR